MANMAHSFGDPTPRHRTRFFRQLAALAEADGMEPIQWTDAHKPQLTGPQALTFAVFETAVIEAPAPHRLALPCPRCHAWLWLLGMIPEAPIPIEWVYETWDLDPEWFIKGLRRKDAHVNPRHPWAHPLHARTDVPLKVHTLVGSSASVGGKRFSQVGSPGLQRVRQLKTL